MVLGIGGELHAYAEGYAAAMRGEDGGSERGRQAGARHVARLVEQGRSRESIIENARNDRQLYDQAFSAALPLFQSVMEDQFMSEWNQNIRGPEGEHYRQLLAAARGRGYRHAPRSH